LAFRVDVDFDYCILSRSDASLPERWLILFSLDGEPCRMKRLREPYLIAGWLVYFIIYGFALRWIIAGGWALSAYFPGSRFMQHVCVLSSFAVHLLASYFLFRFIVEYVVRKSRDEATPTI